MPDTQRPRVPIKPGFFTVPDDPAAGAEAARHPLRGLRRVLLPAPRDVREVPVASKTADVELDGARHALQLHLRAPAAVRLDQHRAHGRLRRRADRPARGAARAGAARRQAGASSASGMTLDGELDVLREDGGTRRRDRPLPAGRRARAMRERRGPRRRACTASGMYADKSQRARWRATPAWRRCDDAGLTFNDVNAAYVGHIFAHGR